MASRGRGSSTTAAAVTRDFPDRHRRPNPDGSTSTSSPTASSTWSPPATGQDGSGTINRPAVAKNALTVGSVHDVGVQSFGLTPGDISFTSSRGPTGDGRMKPNVVAPGHSVTSAWASDLHGYRSEVRDQLCGPPSHRAGRDADGALSVRAGPGDAAGAPDGDRHRARRRDGQEQRLWAGPRVGLGRALGPHQQRRLVQLLVLGPRELPGLSLPRLDRAARHASGSSS